MTGSISVQSQLIQLAWWMRETYGATMNQSLKNSPPGKAEDETQRKKSIRCLLDCEELDIAIREAERKIIKPGCAC